ncbi:hypothetical protein BG000_008585 [Podila horticola]|nr:hypothetical protein BG000_008585 [Podila horticola]
MSGQALGAQAIETSVQVALRIRPIVTDPKNVSKGRSKAETEVLSLIERSPSRSSTYAYESSASSPTPGQHDIPQQVAVLPLQRHFTFDQVFGTHASQEEVYHGSVKRMVDRFMEGYNVTIMAYGQTSSGKTYTMGTGAPSSEDRGSPSEGIIPRAMNQLFREAKRPPIQNYPGYKVPGLKTTFRVSFVEIYNEDLIDLLVKGDFRPPVTIREDTKGNIFWTGVQEIVVSSVEEVIHLLWFGSQNRQTHSTEMNEKSSRSHAIFSITLRQEKFVPAHPPPVPLSASTTAALASEGRNSPTFRRHVKSPSLTGYPSNGMTTSGSSASLTSTGSHSSIPTPFTSGIQAPGSKFKRASIMSESPLAPSTPEDPEPEGEWVTLTSKFHFVDLAGSERLKRTSAIGDRAKEGISINAGLHALGNVISALGDPSKKASHVPYRDSKLTRLLQDSLGGNALALMIACVSPSELNLSETMNTLKYANRARNIKNSSSLNQEINMDNPEYLRTIIQKLKVEIKLLREGATKKALTVNTESAVAADRANPSYRLSTSSTTSTAVHHDIDDRFSSPSPSPSPSMSRRLTHYHSRESIATDISHGYLNAVMEEDNDDQYSETSSSGRTTVGRPSIPSLMLPSVDSKSFQDFVEPVIEEYEKVISGLETHLAMTQAALNHSEQMLEEQQGKIDVIEQEKSVLLSQKRQRSTPSPPPVALAELQRHKELQKELETALQTVQNQLKEAETRKVESEQYISDLETKLAQEQAAQERIQKLLDEHEEAERKREKEPSEDAAVAAKELELRTLSQTVLALQEKYNQHKQAVDAETKALHELKESHEQETEIEKEQREARVAHHEDELIEKLQVKAALEQELESSRERQEILAAELENEAKVPRVRTDSALQDDSKVLASEQVVKSLGVAEIRVPLSSDSFAQVQLLLETQLAEARQSEQQLKQEMADLTEKLEKLEKDHKVSLELEEMLHLAVSDLESRLKVSQDSETKHLAELEENLTRIQELEERSTKAEKEALVVVEELKLKLAEAKDSAEERLTDELLELLEKMEKERSKVEALQTQVENQLVELATERTRATELESDRDTIQSQWDADKARIETLQKDIEAQSLHVQEKSALVVALEERLEKHAEIVAAKLQLEQELEHKLAEHELALGSKSTLISELEEKIAGLETSLEGSGQTSLLVAEVRAELAVAQEELTKSQAQVHDQEQELKDLREKVGVLETETQEARESAAAKETQHAEELQSLQQRLKIAEADRDDAETQLEDAERRHQSVEETVKSLQNNVAIHLATIETLQSRLSESLTVSSSSRPGSMSASTLLGSEGDEQAVRKLEAELSRYRALVRENEREIKRLNDDLEMLASEFSNAATAFEDAEEEMKAKITDLEQFLEEKNLARLTKNNASSVSLASSLASSYTTKNREGGLHPSTSSTSLSTSKTQQQQQMEVLKSERDQALQSSEELSLIVAELNEKNHSLQERLFTLEREHESVKLQYVLESQSQQDELRTLKDRAERQDRSSPSLAMLASARDGHEDERASVVYERILRHKSSTSSENFGIQTRPEDTLATPRQSWSTTATNSTSQPGSQIRPGRHESTLIQQAKQIKLLEEKIAEMQKQQESSSSTDGATSSNIGLGIGIHRKYSEPDLSRSNSSTLMTRQSMERISPSLRALSTFPITPPTPPPTAPLPTPPVMAVNKGHLNNNAPPSPRIGGTMTFENGPGSVTSSSSPHMRPSRTSSFGKNSPRRGERDSASSVFSDSASTTTTNISPATAQALQGVEVNELRGVVDTLAHQVQALKVEQAMQQGKVTRLEASLAETEEKLKTARGDRDQLLSEKETLTKDLERTRSDWNMSKLKDNRDRAQLELALEKERKDRERAVETRVIMEQRMEEMLSKKSKFGCF